MGYCGVNKVSERGWQRFYVGVFAILRAAILLALALIVSLRKKLTIYGKASTVPTFSMIYSSLTDITIPASPPSASITL